MNDKLNCNGTERRRGGGGGGYHEGGGGGDECTCGSGGRERAVSFMQRYLF